MQSNTAVACAHSTLVQYANGNTTCISGTRPDLRRRCGTIDELRFESDGGHSRRVVPGIRLPPRVHSTLTRGDAVRARQPGLLRLDRRA